MDGLHVGPEPGVERIGRRGDAVQRRREIVGLQEHDREVPGGRRLDPRRLPGDAVAGPGGAMGGRPVALPAGEHLVAVGVGGAGQEGQGEADRLAHGWLLGGWSVQTRPPRDDTSIPRRPSLAHPRRSGIFLHLAGHSPATAAHHPAMAHADVQRLIGEVERLGARALPYAELHREITDRIRTVMRDRRRLLARPRPRQRAADHGRPGRAAGQRVPDAGDRDGGGGCGARQRVPARRREHVRVARRAPPSVRDPERDDARAPRAERALQRLPRARSACRTRCAPPW